jgi:hypothetical protein
MSYASAFEEDMVGLDVVRARKWGERSDDANRCTPAIAVERLITAGFCCTVGSTAS